MRLFYTRNEQILWFSDRTIFWKVRFLFALKPKFFLFKESLYSNSPYWMLGFFWKQKKNCTIRNLKVTFFKGKSKKRFRTNFKFCTIQGKRNEKYGTFRVSFWVYTVLINTFYQFKKYFLETPYPISCSTNHKRSIVSKTKRSSAIQKTFVKWLRNSLNGLSAR